MSLPLLSFYTEREQDVELITAGGMIWETLDTI
jgi:hypothetical protein